MVTNQPKKELILLNLENTWRKIVIRQFSFLDINTNIDVLR